MSELEPGSPEWHALRRTGIGGSDMAAVLGLSKWSTPYAVYAEKIGEAAPAPETPRMRWGKLMEPIVRLYYEETTRRKAAPVGFRRHPTIPWLIGNPDGEQLEIKVFASGEGFGEPGTDELPMDVLIQCHHYMLLCDWPSIDVAVPIYANVPRIYTVEPDPIIREVIIERGTEFWTHVERREPPPPVSLIDAQARWGRLSTKGHVQADESTIATVEHARALQKAINSYAASFESAKLAIVSALADRGDTLVDAAGNVLATWKLNKGRKGYEVAEQPPRRQLRIKE